MKIILLSLLCTFGVRALSTAQEESLNEFKREYHHRDGIHSFTVPGFLVRLASNIALHDEDRIDREAIKPLIRNIGSVSVFISDGDSHVNFKDIDRLKSDLVDEDYEPMIKVRDGGDDVEIFAWSKKDIIRRIVFFVQDGSDEFVLVNIRGYFTPEDLSDVIHRYREGKTCEEGRGLKKL